MNTKNTKNGDRLEAVAEDPMAPCVAEVSKAADVLREAEAVRAAARAEVEARERAAWAAWAEAAEAAWVARAAAEALVAAEAAAEKAERECVRAEAALWDAPVEAEEAQETEA